jgi:carboxyl-terminal processing protease
MGLMATLAAFLLGPLAPVPPLGDQDVKPLEKRFDRFAEVLLEAAQDIHENYFVEVSEAELIDWAVEGLFDRVGERMPAPLGEKLRRVARMRRGEMRETLVQARTDAEGFNKLSDDRYLDLALEEMTRHLDSQAKVCHPLDGCILLIDSGRAGVGLKVRSDPDTGLIQIVTPLLGSPAHQAGLEAGDLILHITRLDGDDGKPLATPEIIQTKGLSLDRAARHLRGEPGSRVLVTVRRSGLQQLTAFMLVRAPDPEESVFGYRRKDDGRWDYWLDVERKLAYIRFGKFGRSTIRDLETVLCALKQEGARGLVLDLRFNSGGYIGTTTEVADHFIDGGLIATIRGKSVNDHRLVVRPRRSLLNCPMVCLVNHETARTSEVIAACFQDHGRAVIVGERSAGEAGIQALLPLKGEACIQITSAAFYRPNGKKLFRTYLPGPDEDEWGVTPEPKYTLRLSFAERQELAEHLEQQTYILPRVQQGKEPGLTFQDRQLDIALAYLRTLPK